MRLPGLSQMHEVRPEAWESRGEGGRCAERLQTGGPLAPATDMFCLAHTVFEKYSNQFKMWEVFFVCFCFLTKPLVSSFSRGMKSASVRAVASE